MFGKYSNIKFHENPPSGSEIVLDGQTDMKKLTVAFRNFAESPKNTTRTKENAPAPKYQPSVLAYHLPDKVLINVTGIHRIPLEWTPTA
jgi:hypothetical protein